MLHVSTDTVHGAQTGKGFTQQVLLMNVQDSALGQGRFPSPLVTERNDAPRPPSQYSNPHYLRPGQEEKKTFTGFASLKF